VSDAVTNDPCQASGTTSSALGGYRNIASALNVWRQRRGLALDITGLPGVDQLSSREAELCANARLLPVRGTAGSLRDVFLMCHGMRGCVMWWLIRGGCDVREAMRPVWLHKVVKSTGGASRVKI
jgi:hypothetical protein